jgi:SAM-dependent methyltransferase
MKKSNLLLKQLKIMLKDNFNIYAKYYDLFYQDKNYSIEADYIKKLIDKYNQNSTKTILDFGCGTGKHDLILEKFGYKIYGVDQSSNMIRLAKSFKSNNNYEVGDIRYIDLNKRFDAIISMFHVINYQNSNQDLKLFFQNAYKHLDTNGIFIFDCWNGSAVIKDPAVVRVKKVTSENLTGIRIARPEYLWNENIVNVEFEITLVENQRIISSFIEMHKMRYLFIPELRYFAENEGFEVLEVYDWLTLHEPKISSWYVTYILRKV